MNHLLKIMHLTGDLNLHIIRKICYWHSGALNNRAGRIQWAIPLRVAERYECIMII